MYKLEKAGLFGLLLLIVGCSPHPSSGTWQAVEENAAGLKKMDIHFEPKIEIYAEVSDKPLLECGWWAINKRDIEMECVRLPDTETKERYQFNVTSDDNAQLMQQGDLVARFVRQKD
ncbi:MAG: hypothetical protein OQL06_10990 [Gammaproteobacteria bacterium]|nr:hypothetical protein [Gammaproteobacteria bacterium]